MKFESLINYTYRYAQARACTEKWNLNK